MNLHTNFIMFSLTSIEIINMVYGYIINHHDTNHEMEF